MEFLNERSIFKLKHFQNAHCAKKSPLYPVFKELQLPLFSKHMQQVLVPNRFVQRAKKLLSKYKFLSVSCKHDSKEQATLFIFSDTPVTAHIVATLNNVMHEKQRRSKEKKNTRQKMQHDEYML